MTMEEYEDVVNTHQVGAFRCLKAAWPQMSSQKYGRVVFIGAGGAFFGNFGQANYTSAKGATFGLSMTTAVEGARFGL